MDNELETVMAYRMGEGRGVQWAEQKEESLVQPLVSKRALVKAGGLAVLLWALLKVAAWERRLARGLVHSLVRLSALRLVNESARRKAE